MRVTSDNPCIDSQVLDKVIKNHIDLCADYPTLWSYYHNKQLVIPLICNYIDEYGEKNKLLGKLFTLERNTNVNPELPSDCIS